MVRRILGHVSAHHAYDQAVRRFIDENDITGSSGVVSAVFESRLDSLEDSNLILDSSISSLSSSLSSSTQDITDINNSISSLSSSLSSSIYDVSVLDTGFSSLDTRVTSVSDALSLLSGSYTSLSGTVALLSASLGSTLTYNVGDYELSFDGDTLLTDADIYISGSGNNLYLHGTNEHGNPAKYEFSIENGGTIIKEVPHTDFGDEVSDPWFKFDGDTLLTHADIYVSGSGNYLYMNGTNRQGNYAKFYFDIVSGSVIIKESGST